MTNIASSRSLPARRHDLAPVLRSVLTRLNRRLRQEALLGTEMTPSRFTALVSLELSGPMMLGDLARLEQVAQPTMSRTVAALEALGYVHRTVPPANRRCVDLSLTPSGAAYLEAFRQRRDAYLTTRLSQLSPDELTVLERAMPLLERLLPPSA